MSLCYGQSKPISTASTALAPGSNFMCVKLRFLHLILKLTRKKQPVPRFTSACVLDLGFQTSFSPTGTILQHSCYEP
jgi:hypothetical protein